MAYVMHIGVRMLAGNRLWGSMRIMSHKGGSRLLEVAWDQGLSASCVSLEFIVFWEYFLVLLVR